MIDRFRLGKIVNAVGIKGEVRVYPYTDYKERFDELAQVYVEDELWVIQKVRYMGEMAVIKFQGVEDRTHAEKLKERYLYIDRKNARKLAADEYFVPDLLGLDVIDEAGNALGKLSNVMQNTSQDVYEVTTDDGNSFLIPAVGQFILNIDMDKRQMTVRLIEGMM